MTTLNYHRPRDLSARSRETSWNVCPLGPRAALCVYLGGEDDVVAAVLLPHLLHHAPQLVLHAQVVAVPSPAWTRGQHFVLFNVTNTLYSRRPGYNSLMGSSSTRYYCRPPLNERQISRLKPLYIGCICTLTLHCHWYWNKCFISSQYTVKYVFRIYYICPADHIYNCISSLT